MAYDFRQQRTSDLLKFSQWGHWNQICSLLPLFYRPSVPKVCWRLMTEPLPYRTDGDSFLAIPHPQSVTSSLFQKRKSWACEGLSGSRGLSKAVDQKAQISIRHESQVDCNSEVWKKSCEVWAAFSSLLKMIWWLEQAKRVCLVLFWFILSY